MSTLRYALRSLLKSPGFTSIALVTLALGIGVNTSMFSVVQTLLFSNAPFADAERVVQLVAVTRSGEIRNFSEQEIRDIRPQAEGFSSLTAVMHGFVALAEPGQPAERLHGMNFSSGMMDTFGVQPQLGRSFTAEEFEPGKNQVVLLAHSFWQSRFASDPNVIGRSMRLDGQTVTIVGVMPAAFEYRMMWGNVVLWRPVNFTRDQTTFRAYRNCELIGRLKPGMSASAALAQLAPLAATLEKNYPQDYPGLRFKILTMPEASMDDVGRSISWMLLGLSGFVLLIACANLANLQLARATASAREFAIRSALGASRRRLVLQQLTECILLSIVGGGLGFLVAYWVNHVLETSILIDGAPSLKIPIDAGILLLTLLISLLTGLAFGVLPALFASRTDVNQALKSQARGSTTGRSHNRMRHGLIIGEVALALVLLGGAAIMNRGFSKFLERNTGWDTSRVLTAGLAISEIRFDIGAKRLDLFRKLEDRLAAIPGAEHVALATSLPLFNYTGERPVFLDGPAATGQAPNPAAYHVMITHDYFAAMGIKIIEGTTFARDVKADGPQQIIVNQSLARQFWPNESALGKRLGVHENNADSYREIIGVVRDVEPAANIALPPTRLAVYRPLVQEPWSFVNLVIRSENPAALVEAVRRAVAEVDPDMPADQLGTIRQFVDRTQHNLIVVGQILVGFAVLGLVLAAVGLYGVISNIVAQRTSEFGIRLALGARPSDVMTNVLKRGMWLTGIGLLIGLAGAYGLGRFLGSVMPRLATPDPLALLGVAGLLTCVTLIACWFPARRATKVDPLVALRAE